MKDIRAAVIKKYQETNLFGITLGMDLVKFEMDGIRYRLEINEQHLATPTTAHGGVIAGYMDGVIGLAALYVSSAKGNLVSTVEFKINFITPVRIGDVLIGEGRVISEGNRIIIAEGKITKESNNELVAVATGTFNAYPYEKSGMII